MKAATGEYALNSKNRKKRVSSFPFFVKAENRNQGCCSDFCSIRTNRRIDSHRSFRSFSFAGSILLEAVIMVGLVGALTPVLYTHISNRKEEISNINKANTMLQLQRETEQFLKDKDKRESLVFTDGKATLSPSGLNSNLTTLNNKYQIGFKQNGDNISAVIVEKEGSGNDVKAAKIAGLIGVSAGIKSAMDTDNAYGVNGLWKESLSDYGVSNVPAGSTVVTTAYDSEKQSFYTSDMIVDSDIDATGHKIIADKICIGGDDDEHCRDSWDNADSDLVLLKLCYSDLQLGITTSDYCTRALEKGIISDCQGLSDTYTAADLVAPSGEYYLGNNFTKKVCYFKNGKMPSSAREIIEACNSTVDADRKWACMYDFQDASTGKYAGGAYEGKKYMASCQSIFNAANTLPTGYYTITSSYSENGYTGGEPCVFKSGKAANAAEEVINQCKDSTTANHAACARASILGYTDCTKIKNAGVTSSAFYKVPTGASRGAESWTVTTNEIACYFVSGNLATNSQTVTQCNSDKAGSVACGYGYQNSWNRNCQQVLTVSRSYAEKSNITITTGLKAGNNNQTCYVGQGTSTVNCSATSDYCTHNKGGSSTVNSSYKYCNSSNKCVSTCDDNTDCTAYGSSTPYCISGTCMNCVANGSAASSASLCCSGFLEPSTGKCVASCACSTVGWSCNGTTQRRYCNGCSYTSTESRPSYSCNCSSCCSSYYDCNCGWESYSYTCYEDEEYDCNCHDVERYECDDGCISDYAGSYEINEVEEICCTTTYEVVCDTCTRSVKSTCWDEDYVCDSCCNSYYSCNCSTCYKSCSNGNWV